MSSVSKTARRNKPGGRHENDARYAAITVLQAVLVKGRSLATARSMIPGLLEEPRQRSLAMEMINGVLRWRFRLECLLAKLLDKPLRKKDFDVQLVLLLALYELNELSTPDYAVVNEAVAQVRRMRELEAVIEEDRLTRERIRAGLDEFERHRPKVDEMVRIIRPPANE